MMAASRPHFMFKLKRPIVYETKNQGTKEITEFKVYEPCAGQLKHLDYKNLNYKQGLDLAAECSDLTIHTLDMLSFEDMDALTERLFKFFLTGEKS